MPESNERCIPLCTARSLQTIGETRMSKRMAPRTVSAVVGALMMGIAGCSSPPPPPAVTTNKPVPPSVIEQMKGMPPEARAQMQKQMAGTKAGDQIQQQVGGTSQGSSSGGQ